MLRRRAVGGRLKKRNVEQQAHGVPYALNMQYQLEVTNVEFHESIRMLSQEVTN